MTEQNETLESQKRPARRSLIVVPLIFAFSLMLSGYMTFGYTLIHEEAVIAEIEEQIQDTPESDPAAPDSTEPDAPAPVYETELISEYRAVSGSNESGRAENIRLAAEALNGYTIEPGATLSFNEVVGDTELDERYQLAPIVNGNEMSYGRGGGTCQVSSALYVAALYSDLRIVERHPHSAVVDYAPIGLDATVVYGLMDLVIANDSEYPVTVNTATEGQTVTVQLLGQPLEEGVFIEPVSVLVEYHEAGTAIPNALEWDPVMENTTYYVVESYRDYYYHGQKTESLLLARDTYKVFEDSIARMPDGGQDATK